MFAVNPNRYRPKPLIVEFLESQWEAECARLTGLHPSQVRLLPPMIDIGKDAMACSAAMTATPYARALRHAEHAEFMSGARKVKQVDHRGLELPESSAVVAKRRLRVVIQAEREAFPDAAWVRVDRSEVGSLEQATVLGRIALGFHMDGDFKSRDYTQRLLERSMKPRYRWEQRR